MSVGLSDTANIFVLSLKKRESIAALLVLDISKWILNMFSQRDTSKCISPYPPLMTCYNIKITTLGCGFFTINVNINILTLFTTMRLHVSSLSKKLSMSCHKKKWKRNFFFSKFATTYYYLLNMNIYDQVKKKLYLLKNCLLT